MSRRLTAIVAILVFELAALAVLPGLARAQTGSPPPVTAGPVVAGVVVTTVPAPAVAGVVVTNTSAPTVRDQSLARTGSDLVPMVATAVALVALGVMLVISVRRRRRAHLGLA